MLTAHKLKEIAHQTVRWYRAPTGQGHLGNLNVNVIMSFGTRGGSRRIYSDGHGRHGVMPTCFQKKPHFRSNFRLLLPVKY